MLMRKPGILLVCVLASASVPALAQSSPTLADVVARLDKLEKENQDLMAEIHQLRQELASAQPSMTTSVATTQSPPLRTRPPLPAPANASPFRKAAPMNWRRPKSARCNEHLPGSPAWSCSTRSTTAALAAARSIR